MVKILVNDGIHPDGKTLLEEAIQRYQNIPFFDGKKDKGAPLFHVCLEAYLMDRKDMPPGIHGIKELPYSMYAWRHILWIVKIYFYIMPIS